MNESFSAPQAERVIGKEISPDESKKLLDVLPIDESGKVSTDVKEILREVFYKNAPEVIESLESPKTERDYYLISLATKSVKAFAKELGRNNFAELPTENIHFLIDGGVEKFTEGRLKVGSHATVLGQILIDRRDDLSTIITTFHELWHALASYQAIQIKTDGSLDWYRSGFSSKSRDGKEEWFYRIDEALTGLMTEKFVDTVLKNDVEFTKIIEDRVIKNEAIDTTRLGEAKAFRQIVDEVYEKNKNNFQTKEDIIRIFFIGQVTGNIMPVARLLEKTFGKGAFRKLGEFFQK